MRKLRVVLFPPFSLTPQGRDLGLLFWLLCFLNEWTSPKGELTFPRTPVPGARAGMNCSPLPPVSCTHFVESQGTNRPKQSTSSPNSLWTLAFPRVLFLAATPNIFSLSSFNDKDCLFYTKQQVKDYHISDLQIPSHLRFWGGNPTGHGNLPLATRHNTGLPAGMLFCLLSSSHFPGRIFWQEIPPGLRCQTTHRDEGAAVSQLSEF